MQEKKEKIKYNNRDIKPLDTDKHRIENTMHAVQLRLTNMAYHKVWQGQNEPCPCTTLHNMGAHLGSSK